MAGAMVCADPGKRLVTAARRGLADRDLGQRVARLDAGIGRLEELRVVRGADDLLADELRRQEQLQVRLVPDRPERHRPVPSAAVVPRGEHPRERGQVAELLRHDVRRLATVRPLRRSGDVDHHAQVVEARLKYEVVEVGQLVGRVVAVGGVRRPRRRKRGPGGSRVDHRRALRRGELQILRACRRPPERGVVEEADRHPLCCVRSGGRNGEQRGERDEYETDCFQHERVPFPRFPWAAGRYRGALRTV